MNSESSVWFVVFEVKDDKRRQIERWWWWWWFRCGGKWRWWRWQCGVTTAGLMLSLFCSSVSVFSNETMHHWLVWLCRLYCRHSSQFVSADGGRWWSGCTRFFLAANHVVKSSGANSRRSVCQNELLCYCHDVRPSVSLSVCLGWACIVTIRCTVAQI